ncbi:MAG: carboxy terminal-processing peptidase [Saprospiraceae bacterium]|nr:carboxy terminal-processing peptidase [Saprospiraceae bacterium]
MIMKRNHIMLSLVAVAILVAAFFPKPADQPEKDALLVRSVLTHLEQLHYHPKALNDDFSHKLYDLYLDRLDGGKRFLTQQDVAKLATFRAQLDDQVRAGNIDFFDLSVDLLNTGIKKAGGYYEEILATPFSFDQNENLELDGEKRTYAKNDAELREYWRKYLKYEVMTRVAEKLDEQEKLGEEGEKLSLEEIETAARAETLKTMSQWFERMNKVKRDDRFSYFLNTITNLFDPHTDYLAPIDKQNFNIRFSGRLEGIGARLQTDGDFTKVVEVVVGGPAWKQKDLEENDLIVKVSQGDGEPVDVAGMDINEVVSLVRGEKGTEVRLTVKKKDGTFKVIPIVRDVVILEEGFAKSLILDGAAAGEKIGYLYLPRFYADFENKDGRFCATDVALELEKLKSEDVSGIILDLRNNGGGSLRDVVKMTGFFVEKGPIVQVKSRGQAPEVLSDVDPRVQYDGPLVVMVNSMSASASEILAAALQDYGRAVIVGSNSTFGKGTVQRFYNLDQSVSGFKELKPLGEVKVTTQKFYRINGGSTQLRGVIPDIVLPDAYHFIKTGEKEENYPMEWTELPSVPYQQKVYNLKNVKEIKARSNSRLEKSEVFGQIYRNARRFEQQRDQSVFPLQLDAYRSMMKDREVASKQFEDLFKDKVISGVFNLEVDLPSIHADESKKARNEDFVTSVAKDVYIRETLNIIHDMIVMK